MIVDGEIGSPHKAKGLKMTNSTNLPVLDTHTRDAEIIGYAENAFEAEMISRKHYRDCGNDVDDLVALEKAGVFTYNLRSLGFQDFSEIEDSEIEAGYWDNA